MDSAASSSAITMLRIAREVADALAAKRPVVALESTLISHGLPSPRNVEVALAAEAAVRLEGAVPATIAVHEGRLIVGLSNDEIAALATAGPVSKASRHNLAAALASGAWAGTTVSATMIAAERAGIRVFATGGIGGVHRGGESSLDISADLDELARTPVLVVCAGPKSILDVPRTLEVLETRGVPVIGLGTDEVPGFVARSSGIPVHIRVESAAEAAALAIRHWDLGLGSGLLVMVPVPEAAALPRDEAEAAIAQAIREAKTAGIHGPAATPWILARVADLTDGRSVIANVALIEHDAAIGARIAVAMAASG
ncbi:MAG TPA: pseudouridine-5'-phosphate glycosidase [Candidatus Limnocylindrales bacterium]|jgi:pseudouridine-5'-phosphate glycosidase